MFHCENTSFPVDHPFHDENFVPVVLFLPLNPLAMKQATKIEQNSNEKCSKKN